MSKKYFIARRQELPLKDDSTGLFLQIMVSIAVFIFAITLSGVLSINAMLNNWNQSILGSLTVQIMPIHSIDKDKALAQTIAHQDKVVDFLTTVQGVEKVTPLSQSQLNKLIEPWLGDGVNLDNLPIPRIIDVKIDSFAEIDFLDLSSKLATVSEYASIDNHKLWLNKLIDFADGLKILAMTILLLVVVVTSGAIFYTTQTSLGLHKYIIEILHTMGAKDTYIAQQYSNRVGKLALIGGIVSIMVAIPVVLFIGSLATQIEGGIVSDAELGIGSWVIILSLPVFASVVSMITAYYTVKNTLQKLV